MKKSAAFPGKYLGAADLDKVDGGTIRLKMDHIKVESINVRDGGTEDKAVLYFVGADKGMVVNVTNWDTLEEMFGDESDDWMGKEIVLYKERTRYEGKATWGVRIKGIAPPTPPPVENTPDAPPPDGADIPF